LVINITLVLLPILLGGCGGNFSSIFRTFDVANTKQSIVIDAKQRVIIVSQPPPWKDKEGMVYNYRPIVCAEPSPDALSVLSAAFSASGESQQQFLVRLAGTLNENSSSIGLRTQTITILRDAMYRLCEGYLGEALTATSFERLQRRYQNAMVGLLAIEQLTGAVAAKQVVLAPNASLDTGARGETKNPTAEEKKGGTSGEGQGSSAEKKSQVMQGAKKDANTLVETGRSVQAKTGGASIETESRSGLTREAIEKIGKTVEEVVRTVVNANYTEETCLQYLIDASKDEKIIAPGGQVKDFCNEVLRVQSGRLTKELNK